MSAAKRDNYVFRQVVTAAQAALRSMPRNPAARPDRAAPALGLQASWSEGAKQGSDPYNSCGARTSS